MSCRKVAMSGSAATGASRFSSLLMNERDFTFAFVPACTRLSFCKPLTATCRDAAPALLPRLCWGRVQASGGKEENWCGPCAGRRSRSIRAVECLQGAGLQAGAGSWLPSAPLLASTSFSAHRQCAQGFADRGGYGVRKPRACSSAGSGTGAAPRRSAEVHFRANGVSGAGPARLQLRQDGKKGLWAKL
jgi:hypothetical protein